MTPQQQVGYADLLRVWHEADEIPQIEHAWLFDHLMPIGGDPSGPVLEGWTLLAALAAQTQRLRLGLLVTANRMRPPAVLAKIATTVDVVSAGRLEFGIGVGSRPQPPEARREYPAHGLPFDDFAPAVVSLDEACTIIRRLWTEPEPFDFHGRHHQLTGAFGSPKPVQRPQPPITIAGRSDATLRVVARARRRVEHPRRRPQRLCRAQLPTRPALHRDRSRPSRHHPFHRPTVLTTPANSHPGLERRSPQQRLHPHHARTRLALFQRDHPAISRHHQRHRLTSAARRLPCAPSPHRRRPVQWQTTRWPRRPRTYSHRGGQISAPLRMRFDQTRRNRQRDTPVLSSWMSR